jgi:5-methylcytosine-specific restriction endonuclease McrA
MSKLTVHNPYVEAARQTEGLDRIGPGKNWNHVGYCWNCGKDKPRKGGKVFGKAHLGQPTRFKCRDCIDAAAALGAAP